MAKRNNKPEQATNGGAGNESTATPVDETANAAAATEQGTTEPVDEEANAAATESTTEETANAPVDESAQTTDLNAAEDCAQALANEAFAAHPHINKVWVDEKKGEWHLVKRHGLLEFDRP